MVLNRRPTTLLGRSASEGAINHEAKDPTLGERNQWVRS